MFNSLLSKMMKIKNVLKATWNFFHIFWIVCNTCLKLMSAIEWQQMHSISHKIHICFIFCTKMCLSLPLHIQKIHPHNYNWLLFKHFTIWFRPFAFCVGWPLEFQVRIYMHFYFIPVDSFCLRIDQTNCAVQIFVGTLCRCGISMSLSFFLLFLWLNIAELNNWWWKTIQVNYWIVNILSPVSFET